MVDWADSDYPKDEKVKVLPDIISDPEVGGEKGDDWAVEGGATGQGPAEGNAAEEKERAEEARIERERREGQGESQN